MRKLSLLLLAGAVTLPLGCAQEGPGDPIILHAADYSADAVRFQFDIGRVSGPWTWYIKLDTDQVRDANGHKTGYGEFGEEFRIKATDQVGDSVAVRPTSGPVDPAPGAGGWPLPAGYARLDPSAAVSLTIPKAILADDGLLSYEIWLVDPNQTSGFYEVKSGNTTPQTGSPRALLRTGRPVRRGTARLVGPN